MAPLDPGARRGRTLSAAVDTNVLVDLLAGHDQAARQARDVLDAAVSRGALLVCPAVYAELLAFPGREPRDIDDFLSTSGIVIAWEIAPAIWRRAGIAFAAYGARRGASGGGSPRRLLVDFLVGAHALDLGTLITRDLGFYGTNFPDLRIISPIK